MTRLALALAAAMVLFAAGWVVAPTPASAAGCGAGLAAGESGDCVGTPDPTSIETTDENGNTDCDRISEPSDTPENGST